MLLFFFFNDTSTTEIYTLSLHDALPISTVTADMHCVTTWSRLDQRWEGIPFSKIVELAKPKADSKLDRKSTRLNSSHQIISYAVFCLKKKKKKKQIKNMKQIDLAIEITP